MDSDGGRPSTYIYPHRVGGVRKGFRYDLGTFYIYIGSNHRAVSSAQSMEIHVHRVSGHILARERIGYVQCLFLCSLCK